MTTLMLFGSLAVYERPMTFRPHLAVSLAFSNIKDSYYGS